MTGLEETAYAKINLALHVRAREADGYHALETLFAFCDAGDVLTLEEAPGLRLEGPFGAMLAGHDNLVTRAAAEWVDRFGGALAGFRLDKRLPIASGIGGGSADAAAALRLLARRDGIASSDAGVSEIARRLGADVPACLLSRAARGEGRGEQLAEVDLEALAGAPVLLVNPGVAVSTGAVFKAWDGVDRGSLGQGAAGAIAGRNDLEAPARGLCSEIGDVLAWLSAQPGAHLVRMSGSGATCFALFDDMAARDRAAGEVPAGWWPLATALRA
ncbi:4-(cytidine 5'-diphospho)-2-C-methyl-D-erythritol kinase [Sphingomonas sp. BIUV-7]|uniref:4-diphosphocytidyl-2-C-methyl-D-erythritol kinase n=1 Tax=Sphingomonas natans TaxID=3063330 RepID=A0ABT8Y9W6_9SPHN|nr:4-(cytidine 5'-diphospho)-2-C-methyl-D-erythritol kinase [Sphingomonas sp. BIUV-7]MDO6415131.1 4-(cytidine 5'-diphospho)-2-C-methyl-D-erythritol kinase [Sphingomonas sp. BIUV-7]